MTATRDPEFDAISEKDIFEEARDRLQIALDIEGENRNKGKLDLQFREGDGQWDHEVVTTASAERPEVTINLTDALCQRVENNMREQERSGKAHPVGDGGNVEVAELIDGILRHVETRSSAQIAYDTAGRSAITNGFGYFRAIAEYEHPRSMRRDIRILLIRNVFSVYMDPSAIMPAGEDQNWCILSIMQKRAEYRRLNPRMPMSDWNDVGRGDSASWDNKEEIRLAEYFRIREKEEKLYGLRNALTGAEMTRFESEMPEILPAGWAIDGERDSTRRAVEWFRLNGLKVIDRQQLPGQWIPVFRVEGVVTDIDGKIIRRGMVRNMMDAQRMVNYGESAKIRRLALTPQSPWVAAEGQLEGHLEAWNNAHLNPYVPLFYKPITVTGSQGDILVPPPQRQQPAQIEAGFSEFVQGMRSNLLAVAGMPNEPGADKQGQVVSGIALDKRQILSDQSHLQYAKNLDAAVTQCARVIVEWIPAYYNEPNRIQRIIGADSQPKLVTLNQPDPNDPTGKLLNDVSLGRYDVVLSTGPSFETKRQEGAENLLEMLKIEALAEIIAKTAPDLVFRSIDHPYMQELADRLMAQTPDGLKQIMEQLPERAKAIVMALSNENANLKQALEQAQMEQKYGLAKAHLAATVKAHDVEESNKTKRLDTQVRADTARFDTIVKSHTQLADTEIKAGASLMNTHAEAKHHKEEAEAMIERAATTERAPA